MTYLMSLCGVAFLFLFLFIILISIGWKFWEENSFETAITAFDILVLFILWVGVFFIKTFSEIVIIKMVYSRLQGNDPSLLSGSVEAFRHLYKIFVWSLVSSTLAMVIWFLARDEKSPANRFFVWLLGATWNVLTFFAIPIFVSEKLSLVGTLKKSASLLKNTWGELAIIEIGYGFFYAIPILIGGLVLWILSFIGFNFGIASPWTAIISLTLFIIIFIKLLMYAARFSALGIVVKTILYDYATTGKVPTDLSEESINNAFVPQN